MSGETTPEAGLPVPGPVELPGVLRPTRTHPPAALVVEPPAFAGEWRRWLASTRRFYWLVLGVTVLGTAGGVIFARSLKPNYRAEATIWIETEARLRDKTQGPVQAGELLQASSWVDLLRSHVVLDEIVRRAHLYLRLNSPGDSSAFASFELTDQVTPGRYRLKVDAAGRTAQLTGAGMSFVQRLNVGDSVGPALGFAWRPGRTVLTPGRTLDFLVMTPGQAAEALGKTLRIRTDWQGSFMSAELSGPSPSVASTLNAVAERFVEVATELKREKYQQVAQILSDQLREAEMSLHAAETALKQFRVQTVGLVTATPAAVASGSPAPHDPALANLIELKVDAEQLTRDKDAIERALTGPTVSVEGLAMIGSVQRSAELTQALKELTSKQADLRALRYRYTDQNPPTQELAREVDQLEQRTIPSLARALIAGLTARQGQLGQWIDSTSRNLREVPPLAIEEARLQRDVNNSVQLFTNIQQRYEEAHLAAVSSMPDVRVLDAANPPLDPVFDLAPLVIVLSLVGSLGLGVTGAVLLDRGDPTLKYPEQVTKAMGLTILGAVPYVERSPAAGDAVGPVIEALRGIRLNLRHAYGAAGPMVVTVTSPNSGDGKSFIASNLAAVYADAGYRTLLIDGDIRRGVLHRVLHLNRRPGLTDLLGGRAPREEVIQATRYTSLSFVGSGSRTRSGPELLSADAMAQFLTGVRGTYEVILVDSPPLAAGVDAFALGTLTGSLLLVLRPGVTDRALAEAKLDVLDRLPVRLLGAVLNGVQPGGAYRYYSYYLAEYRLPDTDEAPPERKAPRELLRGPE